jgi:hypothetical protein
VRPLLYNRSMPLPEIVRVKYTEEEAEYVTIRPVVQQQFRGSELVDMIVRVTGKDPLRIQQILRSGTIVFHAYRYWWQSFEPGASELGEILAQYPDPDFTRPFRTQDCVEVILESSGLVRSPSMHVRREDARRKKLLRKRSFWDCLMGLAQESAPAYREYSYAARADLYSALLERPQVARLALEARRYATGAARANLAVLVSVSQIVYACPR